jgi:hypothetical protein
MTYHFIATCYFLTIELKHKIQKKTKRSKYINTIYFKEKRYTSEVHNYMDMLETKKFILSVLVINKLKAFWITKPKKG